MEDNPTKATPEKLEQAQKLLIIAGLPPENRMECEGIIALGLDLQITELTANLQKLISEKEDAYIEYKNTIKTAIQNSSNKP